MYDTKLPYTQLPQFGICYSYLIILVRLKICVSLIWKFAGRFVFKHGINHDTIPFPLSLSLSLSHLLGIIRSLAIKTERQPLRRTKHTARFQLICTGRAAHSSGLPITMYYDSFFFLLLLPQRAEQRPSAFVLKLFAARARASLPCEITLSAHDFSAYNYAARCSRAKGLRKLARAFAVQRRNRNWIAVAQLFPRAAWI